MVRVNSSAIVAIGYDEQTARMRIQFQQGHSYDFCRVPSNVHAAFMCAYSKDIYYNEHIKDQYQC
nr:KTSC domain-containing protein [Janthinobacterium lividum]